MPTLIYDDAPRSHDHYAGARDFARAVAAAQAGAAVVVPITLASFHRLPRLLRFAAALRGHEMAGPLPEFDVARESRLLHGLMRHMEEIKAALRGAPVAPGDIDPALRKVLSDFDARATPRSRPDLLRLLGVLADEVFIGPHTFHLDITNVCNTNCTFCGLHSPLLIEPAKPMPGRRFTEGWKDMKRPWDEFAALVDDLDALGAREDILFSGEGEPLTHPRIFEMIRYVCGKGMNLTLFTNGLLVNEKSSEVFVDADMAILYWSLSAGTPETFAKLQPMHKPAAFTKMIADMEALVRRKRLRNNRPYVILAHVINSENYRECERVMEIAARVGVDSVRYQIMHSCTSTESLLLTHEMFDEAKRQIGRARLIADARGIEIVANIDFQLKQSEQTYGLGGVLPCQWSHGLYEKSGCLAGWFFSRGFTDGMISFCCHDKIVGTLARGPFRDIWQGEEYRRARMAAKAFDPAINIDLSYGGCGGPLLGDDCASCGNYEFINQALADLSELGWDKFLRRIGPG